MSMEKYNSQLRNEFTPYDLKDLALWLDGNDISTFTFNSNQISQWRDKSNNQLTFNQSTPLKQPYFIENLLNNKSGVRFGEFEFTELLTSSIPLDTFLKDGKNVTVFMVLRQTTKNSHNVWHHTVNASNLFNYANYTQNSQTFLEIGNQSSARLTINGTTQLFNNFFILSGIRNGGFMGVYKNGNLVGSKSNASGTHSGTAIFYLGSYGGSGRFYGEICEFIIKKGVASTKEIDYTENYLSIKWGIS